MREISPLMGNTTCVVGENEPCGEPGVFCLFLNLPEGPAIAVLCQACFDQFSDITIQSLHVHPIGPNCGMPGTCWYKTGCFIP